eukprot:9779561-Prorocentrum_lima.AAC.1
MREHGDISPRDALQKYERKLTEYIGHFLLLGELAPFHLDRIKGRHGPPCSDSCPEPSLRDRRGGQLAWV